MVSGTTTWRVQRAVSGVVLIRLSINKHLPIDSYIRNAYLCAMTTPITPIRLPLDIKAVANKRATEEGTNLTQLIIKAVNEYLNK